MNKQAKNKAIRTTSVLVMAIYLFIVVAYLFFTPAFQNKSAQSFARVKSNTQVIYILIRTNRCMMNDNKSSRIKVKQLAALAIPVISGTNKLLPAFSGKTCAFNFLIDRHSIYLSNRVLRI